MVELNPTYFLNQSECVRLHVSRSAAGGRVPPHVHGGGGGAAASCLPASSASGKCLVWIYYFFYFLYKKFNNYEYMGLIQYIWLLNFCYLHVVVVSKVCVTIIFFPKFLYIFSYLFYTLISI